jgi:hypothetical protein
MSSIKSKIQASNNKEFQSATRVLSPMFEEAKNGNISIQELRSAINGAVGELSEETFSKDFIADTILSWINVREDVSKQFPDTNTQVQSILLWLPRMAWHKDRLEKYVNKYRKQYGLKL